MKVAAIVLAAGASTRLGKPKQSIRLCDGTEDTLLDRTVQAATLAGLGPIIVVVSPTGPAPRDRRTQIVVNAHPEEGMASSIRAGVNAAAEVRAGGVVILACDQPAVTAEHLRALMEDSANCSRIVASEYAGRRGVPACFPASAFEDLLSLRGDTGARDLIRHAHAVSMPGGELDIDTLQDLAIARQLYTNSASK